MPDWSADEARLEGAAPGYLAQVRASAARIGQRGGETTDAKAALEALEELAVVDLDVPTASRYPAARRLKAVVKQLVGWYLRYVGDQVSSFGQAVSHFGTLLEQRTENLEKRSERLEGELGDLAARVERLERSRPGP